MKEVNLSNQAVGAVMMALQKSLMEQSDIVPVLKGFKFNLSEEGLVVMNPPLVKFNEETTASLRAVQQIEEAADLNGLDVVTTQPSTSK